MCMESKQGMTPTGGKELYSGTMGTNQGRGAANFRSMGGSVAPVSASPSASVVPESIAFPSKSNVQSAVSPKPYGERLLDEAISPKSSVGVPYMIAAPREVSLTDQQRKEMEAIVGMRDAEKAKASPEAIAEQAAANRVLIEKQKDVESDPNATFGSKIDKAIIDAIKYPKRRYDEVQAQRALDEQNVARIMKEKGVSSSDAYRILLEEKRNQPR